MAQVQMRLSVVLRHHQWNDCADPLRLFSAVEKAFISLDLSKEASQLLASYEP